MTRRGTPSAGRSTTHSGWLLWAAAAMVIALLAITYLMAGRTEQASDQEEPPAPANPAPSFGSSVDPTPRPETSGPDHPDPGGEPATGLAADVARAKQVIDSIPVKGRAPKTGYDREQFGSAWTDIDGNGCDTRNDILQRDLTSKVVTDDCLVESGVLTDPFSGDVVDFVRGTTSSSEVQIDHMVSLSNAWQTGAQQLTSGERTEFANDPGNLLAVRGDLNQQKRDGDAATWLPPNKSFRCEFIAIQILTKHKHGLWLTSPEKAAALRILSHC